MEKNTLKPTIRERILETEAFKNLNNEQRLITKTTHSTREIENGMIMISTIGAERFNEVSPAGYINKKIILELYANDQTINA